MYNFYNLFYNTLRSTIVIKQIYLTMGFPIERSVEFSKLVDTIYEETNIDRENVSIEITHKPPIHIFGGSVVLIVLNDADVKDLMPLYRDK